jgi:nucleoside-diphosphate-sugar epimerase
LELLSNKDEALRRPQQRRWVSTGKPGRYRQSAGALHRTGPGHENTAKLQCFLSAVSKTHTPPPVTMSKRPHASGEGDGKSAPSPHLAAVTDGLRGAHVLVTGASGFIGRNVCHALSGCGARITAFVGRDRATDILANDIRSVNLQDCAAVEREVRRAGVNYVVHLAAKRIPGDDMQGFHASYEANLFGTLNLAGCVVGLGKLHRFVYLSSAEEYGRAPVPFQAGRREAPLTAYGLSKLAATQLLQALAVTHGLPIAVLRATVVYGPGQAPSMFVPALVRALVDARRFPMTTGEQSRDLIYVDDVVDGILRALVFPTASSDVLNLSANTPMTVRDVALLAAKVVGDGAQALLDFGAIPYRQAEVMEYWADNTAARAAIGWMPNVSLEDGLKQTVAHYRRTRGGV